MKDSEIFLDVCGLLGLPTGELGPAVISLIGSKTREITMKTLTLAAIRCSIIFTAAAALLVVAPLTQAGYIVTLQQGGSNVVATGKRSH